MQWTRVAQNWNSARQRLQAHFTELAPETLDQPPARMEALVAQVAACHDLTVFEARDALEALLFTDSLPCEIRRRVG